MRELFDLVSRSTTTAVDIKTEKDRVFALLAAKGPDCFAWLKNFYWQDSAGNTPLHIAAKVGNPELIVPLLEFLLTIEHVCYDYGVQKSYGYDNIPRCYPSSKNKAGETFIDILIKTGDEDRVLKMIDEIDVFATRVYDEARNFKKSMYFQPYQKFEIFQNSIRLSIARKSLKLLKRLLNYQTQDSQYQLHVDFWDLHEAIKFDFQEGVDLLLQHKRLEECIAKGDALRWAIEIGTITSLRNIIRHPKINPNTQDKHGRTALHHAAAAKKIDMMVIKTLIDGGARTDIYDRFLKTPLDIIQDRQDPALLTQLEEILSERKSNQERFLQKVLQLESLKDRLSTVSYAVLDLKLFAHIHLDAISNGSLFEGISVTTTSEYFSKALKAKFMSDAVDKIFKLERYQHREDKIRASLKQFSKMLEIFHKIALFMDIKLSAIVLDEPGYLSSTQRTERRDKMYAEISEYIASLIITTDEEYFIPGGYLVMDGNISTGHAMAYGLKFNKDGSLQFAIYNTGEGSKNHPSKESGNKTKHCPVMIFLISKDKIAMRGDSLKELLYDLIKFRFEAFLSSEKYSAAKLYQDITSTLNDFRANPAPAPKDIPYTTGQRAGNCAWKIIQLLFKLSVVSVETETLDQEIYEILKFEYHFQSLLEFYAKEIKFETLHQGATHYVLKEAIHNLSHTLYYKLPDVWKSSSSHKEYIRDIALCFRYILESTNALISRPRQEFAYDKKEMNDYSAPFKELSTYGGFKKPSEEKEDRELVWQAYTPGAQIPDSTFLKGDLVAIESQIEKIRATDPGIAIKIFENSFLHIPIYGEKADRFWAKIDRKSAFQIMQLVCRLTRLYLCTSVRITSLLLPSTAMTLCSLSTIRERLCQIMFGKGFKFDDDFGLNNYQYSSLFSDMLFCHEFAELDARYSELEAASRFEKSSSRTKLNWVVIAERYIHSSQLEDIAWEIKHKNRNLDDLKIKDMKKFAVLALYDHRNFENDLLMDLDFYVLCTMLEQDIYGAIKGDKIFDENIVPLYSDFARLNQSQRNKIFRIGFHGLEQAKYGDTVEIDFSLRDERETHDYTRLGASIARALDGDFSKPKRIKKDINAKTLQFIPEPAFHHPLPDDKTISELYHFDAFQYESALSSNKIQTRVKGELTQKVSETRRFLHTRSEMETAPFETVDLFLSQIPEIVNCNIKTLIICNLMNPGRLKNTLEQKPWFAEQLLEFIQQGLQYHIDGRHIDHAVPYLFKLNHCLIDYMRMSSHSETFDSNIKRAFEITERILKLLAIANPASHIFGSPEKRLEAELLYLKLNFNLIHIIALEFDHLNELNNGKVVALEAEGPQSIERITEVFKAILYIGSHRVVSRSADQMLDPTAPNILCLAQYHCAPYLKVVLEDLFKKKPQQLLELIKPIILDIYPSIEHCGIQKFNFPKLHLESKLNGEQFTIDCLAGTVVSLGLQLKNLPSWVYENKNYLELFGETPRQGFVSDSENTVVFTVFDKIEGSTPVRYRIERRKESSGMSGRDYEATNLYKEITIEKETRWFPYHKYTESEIPAFLRDTTMEAWADQSVDEADVRGHYCYVNIVFANHLTGVNQYYYSAADKRIYLLAPNGKILKREILNITPDLKHPVTPFSVFHAFEAASFTKIIRDLETGDLYVDYIRYGIRLKSKFGSPYFIWENDPRYRLKVQKSQNFIKGFSSYLHFEPHFEPSGPQLGLFESSNPESELDDIILIPRQVFFADPRSIDQNSATDAVSVDSAQPFFRPLLLDTFGLKLDDLCYSGEGNEKIQGSHGAHTHQFNPIHWDLNDSARAVKFSLKTKERTVKANSSDDYLFLSYLNLGCHQFEDAFLNLDLAKAFGFSGNHLELDTIYQIFQGVPATFKSFTMQKLEPDISSLSKAAQINNAWMIGFKAKLLALLYQHISMGGSFKFLKPEEMQHRRHFDRSFAIGMQELLQMFFEPRKLSELLHEVMNDYHKFVHNIPKAYQLKEDELILLLGRLVLPKRFELAKYQDLLKFYRLALEKGSYTAEPLQDVIPIPRLKAKAPSVPAILEDIGIRAYKPPTDLKLSQDKLLVPESQDDKFFVEQIDILNADYDAGSLKNELIKLKRKFYLEEFNESKRAALKERILKALKDLERLDGSGELDRRRKQLIELANRNTMKSDREILSSLRALAEGRYKLSFEDVKQLFRKRDYKLYAEMTALSQTEIETLFSDTLQYFLELNLCRQYQRILALLKDIELLQKSERAGKPEMSAGSERPERSERSEKAASSQSGSDLFVKYLSELIEIALAELNYGLYYREHQALIFECEENILIRPTQLHHINELSRKILGRYLYYVFKMQMGEGKTKVVNPMATFHCADGEHFVELDVPIELLQIISKDHQWKAKRSFNQEIVLFEFNRSSDCSIRNLTNIRDKFLSLIHNRGCIITSAQTKQSLLLKWLELLSLKISDDTHYQQILLLEDILDLFVQRGVVLIDELDADPNQELNFTLDSSEAIDEAQIEATLKFYFDILDTLQYDFNASADQMPKFSLKDFLAGRIPPLSKTEVNELKVLIVSTLFQLPSSITNLKIEHLTESDLQSFGDYLIGESKEIPAFIRIEYAREIKSLEEAKGKDEKAILKRLDKLKSQIELIAFYKAQISEIFPITSAKVPNVNYGYSKDKERDPVEKRIVTPYFGNNAPNERAKFANHLVTMNLTIQMTLIFGISDEVMEHLLKEVLDAAIKERDMSFGLITSIDETQPAREFYKLTGLSKKDFPLRSLNLNIPAFKATAKKREVLEFCLKKYILPTIKIHTKILRQNAQDYCKLAATIRGCSGTFESVYLLDENLRKSFSNKLYEGIDGQTLEFLTRPEKKVAVYRARTEDPFAEVAAILQKNKDFRAIMDAGAIFQGIQNLGVARLLADFYKDSGLLYILFFDEDDKLYALSIKEPHKKPKGLRDSDWKTICAELNCEPKDYFSYYDHLRIKGIDFRHMAFARGLVTLGSQTKLNDVLQATKRMRDETHSVDILVSKQLSASLPQDRHLTIRDAIRTTAKRQLDSVLTNNYRVALQKIHSLLRFNLLTRLRREKNKHRKYDIYEKLAKLGYIYTEFSSSLFKTFGHCTGEVNVDETLYGVMNDEFNRFKLALKSIGVLIDEKELVEIEDELKEIVKEAIKVCHERVVAPLVDYLDAEVQVVAQVTAASTSTTNSNSQNQTHSAVISQSQYQNEILRSGADVKPIDDRYLSYDVSIYRADLPALTKAESLNYYLQDLTDGFRFGKELLVSHRFWNTWRGQDHFKLDFYTKTPVFIVHIQSKSRGYLQSILITEQEAAAMNRNMQKYHRDASISKQTIWITTKKGLHYAGQAPDVKLSPDTRRVQDARHVSDEGRTSEVKRQKELTSVKELTLLDEILEQALFFSADVYWLAQKANRGELCWLSKEGESKLRFFEKYLKSLHPECVELYQRYQKMFQRVAQGLPVAGTQGFALDAPLGSVSEPVNAFKSEAVSSGLASKPVPDAKPVLTQYRDHVSKPATRPAAGSASDAKATSVYRPKIPRQVFE